MVLLLMDRNALWGLMGLMTISCMIIDMLCSCSLALLQVVFEGGATNIVGVVEGVQMTRTLLVSTDLSRLLAWEGKLGKLQDRSDTVSQLQLH
jgi:hypothetical protein